MIPKLLSNIKSLSDETETMKSTATSNFGIKLAKTSNRKRKTPDAAQQGDAKPNDSV